MVTIYVLVGLQRWMGDGSMSPATRGGVLSRPYLTRGDSLPVNEFSDAELVRTAAGIAADVRRGEYSGRRCAEDARRAKATAELARADVPELYEEIMRRLTEYRGRHPGDSVGRDLGTVITELTEAAAKIGPLLPEHVAARAAETFRHVTA